MQSTKDFMLALCSEYAGSSFESPADKLIINAFSPLVDEIRKGKIGNLIFRKKGKSGKKRIAIVAHMDEIGMMVKEIDDNGFIRVANSGGVYPPSVLNQPVLIFTKDGAVSGVTGTSSLPDEPVRIEDIFVDVGLSAEEAKDRIAIGSPLFVDRAAVSLSESRLSARAMDDKAGVGILYHTAKCLKAASCDSDIFFVATAQEEMGMKGAETVWAETGCDYAIAIDVGFGNQPDMPSRDTLTLGKGSAVIVGPLSNDAFVRRLLRIAEEKDIPCQYDVFPTDTGCDGDVITASGYGVPTFMISVPSRYMHSCIEVADIHDIESMGELLAAFLCETDRMELEEMLCY